MRFALSNAGGNPLLNALADAGVIEIISARWP
jgi:hypothetical protein